MTVAKPKMSASYKAIFILSILMVFFVLLAGAATNSKSSGFGMWIWGYTAWLMYKRRNADLVSFYKLLLWFDVVAAVVAIAVLTFSDSDVSRLVGYTITEALVLFVIVISVTYGLYRYFLNSQSKPTLETTEDSSDTYLWEKVSEEIKNGERIDSLWTRAFAEADGDNNKANARYIKLRLEQIKNSLKSASDVTKGSTDELLKLPTKKSKPIHTGLFLLLVAIFAYVSMYFLLGNYKNNSSSSSAESTQISEKSVVSPKQVSIYRKLNDGVLMRWSNDKECFIHMNIDFSSSAIPVSLSKTNERKTQFFKELTQENFVIAVLYYDGSLSDETITKFINKDIFLKIKSMCQ